MNNNVTVVQARAYISDTDLPPQARELSPPDPTVPTPTGATDAVVIGPQLAGFTDKVEPPLRSAVSKALLLASLVAQNAVGGGPEKAGWFAAYKGALASI